MEWVARTIRAFCCYPFVLFKRIGDKGQSVGTQDGRWPQVPSTWQITPESDTTEKGQKRIQQSWAPGPGKMYRLPPPSPSTRTRQQCHFHHYHHLALQPFVGFRLLSQASPSSSVLSCFLPVFLFSAFLNLPWHPLAIAVLVFLLV